MKNNSTPQDFAAREAIINDIGQTMLVEASAGTGKTTSMVARMLTLIRSGVAIENIVAITFTRKAAAELQGRFYRELQANAKDTALPPESRQRFERALSQIDRCYIGTIHSYCASLLRERPFEAGVGMNFSEIDEDADKLIRNQAWNEFVARCLVSDDEKVNWAEMLEEVGLNFNLARSAFFDFCEYPDVCDWPAENPGLPTADDLKNPAAELNAIRQSMLELQPALPKNSDAWGNDKLMPKFFRLPNQIERLNINQPADMLIFLEENFSSQLKLSDIVQKNWPDKDMAKEQLAKWNAFCENSAQPLIERLFAYRYWLLLEIFRSAAKVYDEIRLRMNALNFQDLLMLAARMLRNRGDVREYYSRQNMRLLVDEFQDTDPIQAELMFLLTADDASQNDWRKCTPKPGSLFVVGDPKQSIYRFRRADIQTYNLVKKKIAACGTIQHLTCNFRSSSEVIDWVNNIFGTGSDEFFGAEATDTQAAAEFMHVGRDDAAAASQADINGVYSLTIDQPGNKTEPAVLEESRKIAAFIRDAIDAGRTIADFRSDGTACTRPVRAGDFMIITSGKKHMAAYARALNEQRLPSQVTGGGELNGTPEIKWLLDCLRAVSRPTDAVALVASLRSELWGISDADLLEFKRASGIFNYRTAMPDSLPPSVKEKFSAAFDAMKKISRWLDDEFPPVVVVEKMLGELGLLMRGAARPGGMAGVGAMCRLLELLRNRQREKCSAAQLVDMLQDIVDGEIKFDAIPPRPLKEQPVRVMNLHKAKGLQAPVVFLACPRGKKNHDVASHIHRGEDGVKGYMSFFRETAFGKTAIAIPCGWKNPGGWSDIESGFLQAERIRLLYVAATRAGRTLVVSSHTKSLESNFWNPFREMLNDELTLPKMENQNSQDIERTCPRERWHGTQTDVSNTNVAALTEQIEAQKAELRRPTYLTRAAKSLAMEHAETVVQLSDNYDSFGQNWGSAVHRLLEIYMRDENADLCVAAEEAVKQYDLGAVITSELVQTVRGVGKSELWSRAKEAEKCFVEAPFEICTERDGLPVIVSGVIDLAFKTPDGWVIADYKTDAGAMTAPREVVEHYRPQMELYADVWRQATGGEVCEMGIYLVAADKYVTL